jgi:hypothetical protein
MPRSMPALPYPMRKDSLAERSKAVAQGDILRGRGLEYILGLVKQRHPLAFHFSNPFFHQPNSSNFPTPRKQIINPSLSHFYF